MFLEKFSMRSFRKQVVQLLASLFAIEKASAENDRTSMRNKKLTRRENIVNAEQDVLA